MAAGRLAAALAFGAVACGAGTPQSRPSSEAPAPAEASRSPDDSRFAPPPPPAEPRAAEPPASEPPRGHPPPEELPPEEPLPELTATTGRREAYAQTEAEIARVSRILGEKNREVVERYGRNDTPEGLRLLTPLRERLRRAQRHREHLLCWDQPVSSPRQALQQMQIRMNGHRADSRWVEAYIQAKVADGDLSAAEADDLRFVLSRAGHGVMNPSSLGAGTINRRIVQALSCFGLSGPPRSRMALPPQPAPPPPPARPGLRYFRTCGDAVCSGYRGPTRGVARCRGESEGAPCSQSGALCDLANNCNMYLICAASDPSTRCPR